MEKQKSENTKGFQRLFVQEKIKFKRKERQNNKTSNCCQKVFSQKKISKIKAPKRKISIDVAVDDD